MQLSASEAATIHILQDTLKIKPRSRLTSANQEMLIFTSITKLIQIFNLVTTMTQKQWPTKPKPIICCLNYSMSLTSQGLQPACCRISQEQEKNYTPRSKKRISKEPQQEKYTGLLEQKRKPSQKLPA